MRTFGLIVLAIIAIPVVWAGSAWVYEGWNTYTYRYRLTIEVETPAGAKSSASVIEVSIREKASWVPQTGGVTPSARGEAVFVDLGGGRNVIALLASGPNASNVDYPYYIVPTHFHLSNDHSALMKYSGLQGQWDLPAQTLPTLVTFSDLNDPKTARLVRPEEFESVFGKGVHFKRASVEMTNEPVTTGIEKQLPWWNNPGRPANEAYRAWLAGETRGPSIGPETLFKRN